MARMISCFYDQSVRYKEKGDSAPIGRKNN